MLKCLIVDDEVLARLLLKEYIDKLDFLNLVGSFGNPLDAFPVLQKESIDIIFLDIQMPQLKGTDVAKMVSSDTHIIFTTAYSEYAVESYELNALDYLLKPIEFDRFLLAINKAKEKSTQLIENDVIVVKSGYELYRLKRSEILFIKSDLDYVIFHLKDQQIMSHDSLKSLESILAPSLFKRVHRSYIVNKNAITTLKSRTLYIGETPIPVGDKYYETIKKELFS